MLMLSILHSLLSQVLAPPHLHTAVLFTTSGELVSATSDPLRPKDEIRIVVGLSGEVWQETKEQGYGMVDSEVRFVLHLKYGIINALCLARENYRNSNRRLWGRRPPLLRRSPTTHAPCIECDGPG